ncbi:MerR family transcriptional regulator [Domibacillus robiginosus]|uniref:MerR family transcriptional regulator n=1 Tax=Domibacillus robiginosus TaxID=1071054 RepID=UPI00067AD01B|nr:MerR family transcriptional regulator [Domibacillus robiginosus]
MEEDLYSIGEMAKLANLSVKTLRYYDQIGLFKPAYVDPKTNYRYYVDSQLFQLDLIQPLKAVNTPLQEIKLAQDLSSNELYDFLSRQELKIQQQIKVLQDAEKSLSHVKKNICFSERYTELNKVIIQEEGESCIVQMRAEGISTQNVMTKSYSQLKRISEATDGFLNNGYGATFSFQNYASAEDILYRHLFIPVLTNKQTASLPTEFEITTIPAGKYALIVYEFNPEAYWESYSKLVDTIVQQQFTVLSDVYELFMPIHYSPRKPESYLVEMKIRIFN